MFLGYKQILNSTCQQIMCCECVPNVFLGYKQIPSSTCSPCMTTTARGHVTFCGYKKSGPNRYAHSVSNLFSACGRARTTAKKKNLKSHVHSALKTCMYLGADFGDLFFIFVKASTNRSLMCETISGTRLRFTLPSSGMPLIVGLFWLCIRSFLPL